MNYEEQIKEYIDSSIVYTKEIFQNLGDNFLLPVYISAYYTAVCIDTFRNDELSKNIMEFSIANYCDSEELANFYFEIIEDFIYVITNENNYIGKALILPDSLNNEKIEKNLSEFSALNLLFDFLYYSNTDEETFYIKLQNLNHRIPIEFWKCNNIYYYENKKGLLLKSLEHYLSQHEKIQALYKEYEKTLVDTSLLILNTIKDMVDTEIETRQTQQTKNKEKESSDNSSFFIVRWISMLFDKIDALSNPLHDIIYVFIYIFIFIVFIALAILSFGLVDWIINILFS